MENEDNKNMAGNEKVAENAKPEPEKMEIQPDNSKLSDLVIDKKADIIPNTENNQIQEDEKFDQNSNQENSQNSEPENNEENNENVDNEETSKKHEHKHHHHHHHHKKHSAKHKKPLASTAVLFDPNLYAVESSSEDEKKDKKEEKPAALPTIASDEYNKDLKNTLKEAKVASSLKTTKKFEEKIIIKNSVNIDNIIKESHVINEYNAMLNQTDIAYGKLGHNKFYLLQILESNDKKYYVYHKYGRVGASNPQTFMLKCKSRLDAILEFEHKFFDKTGNQWQNYGGFRPIEGKYTLINAEGTPAANSLSDLIKREEELKKVMDDSWGRPSNLPSSIKDLMSLIWDLKRMQRTMKEMNIDPEKCPLGRLSKDQIQKGFVILGRIQDVLISGKKNEDALTRLSNEFYTAIPQSYGMHKPPIINHITKISQKTTLLESLSDIDLAHNYLVNALNDLKIKSAADVFYDLLKCEIKPVPMESPEFNIISESMRNTHGPTHKKRLQIEEIFSINKAMDEMRYFPYSGSDFPNKRLLWHGSRLTNMAGILMNSLKIAPPEAPTTGYMFGKGIYLADVCTKAANYCMSTKENPEILLLLCEVALGNMQPVYSAKSFKKPNNGYHSVNGVGKMCPDPEQSRICEEIVGEKAKIDMGKIIENPNLKNMKSELIYNEYIVYDISQVKMRYLVKCKTIFLSDFIEEDLQ